MFCFKTAEVKVIIAQMLSMREEGVVSGKDGKMSEL